MHYALKFSALSETFIYDQLLALQDSGDEAIMVTNKRLNHQQRPYADVITLPYQSSRVRDITYRLLRRLGLYPWLINYQRWQAVLNEVKPEVIHCHFAWVLPELVRVLDKLKLDTPILVALHGSDTLSSNKVFWDYKSLILRAVKERTIRFTVPSNALKNKAMARLGLPDELIAVVPNPVNPAFSFKKGINQSHDGVIKLITVGRLIKWKGHRYLMGAVKTLRNAGLDVQLTVVGDGDQRKALTEQVERLGLAEYVAILGAKTHSQVVALLNTHNFYIQPSITDPASGQAESFGVAVIEALASGLPVVVTDSGGLPETVSGGRNGYAEIVAEQSSAAIVQAVEKLIKYGRNQVYRQEVFEDLLAPFSTVGYVDRIQAIYQELMTPAG